jgi:hypothetical protein
VAIVRTRNAASYERARAELTARLAARRPEIEQAVLTRVQAVTDANDSSDPEYREGLRSASSAALDYAFAVIERGEERAPEPPPALLAQARLAARNGIGLDTVLRRYSAGYVLLFDFLVEEVEGSGLRGADLQRLMRSQVALDSLLAAVGEEHSREVKERLGTSERRRAERIERLLAGELLDTSVLGYDVEGNHLGAIGAGPGTLEALQGLAIAFDFRLLAVQRDGEAAWAWLGSRRPIDLEELQCHVAAIWPVQCALAIGEPGEGLPAWRLTHRQAKAALPIALRGPERVVRYADVALLASILQDDLLATSLRRLYLEPLEVGRDGGEVAKETLRAYFDAERNISSAAASLRISRQAVNSRMRVIEERLGRPLRSCAAEVEAVLRLTDFTSTSRT